MAHSRGFSEGNRLRISRENEYVLFAMMIHVETYFNNKVLV